MKATRDLRAFTLLELIVGLTLSLGIAGVAMGLLVNVQQTQKDTMLKNAVTRDAMYMLDMVGGDLGYAGVGVPSDVEIDGRAGRLRPIIRVGGLHQLAFIGDLPLPNADLNGLAVLSDIDGTGDSNDIAVTSELSLCAPTRTATYHCDTRKNSLVQQSSTSDCSSDNTSTSCPWALGKWADTSGAAFTGQLLLLTTPGGQWTWRRVATSAGGAFTPVAVGPAKGLQLDIDFPSTGAGKLKRSQFLRPSVGATSIATLDRVFYSVEKLDGSTCAATDTKCVLVRRQCWGEALDPTAAGFPAAGSFITSANTPAGCTAPDEGTRWEPVANNLAAFEFHYFKRDDTELIPPTATSSLSAADLALVTTIEVKLVIARDSFNERSTALDPNALRHRVERRFFIDSSDGFGTQGRR